MWQKTDPDEYIAVSQDKISEAYLKEHHLKFFREDHKKMFYVEKNGLQKFKDYTIRTLATPVTLTLDATTTIVVVGAVVFVVFKAPRAPGYESGSSQSAPRQDEWQRLYNETRNERQSESQSNTSPESRLRP